MRRTLLILVTLLLLCGCTQENINRLEAVVVDTQKKVEQAESALAKAKAVLDTTQKVSDAVLGEQKAEIVSKVQMAVEVATDALSSAKATATAAKTSLDAAKAAQEAGGSTIDIILAGVLAFATGGAVAVPAISRSVKLARALAQTVKGLDTSREALGEAEWKAKVAHNLAEEQDVATKRMISNLQS